jgi:hypothetical protein
MSIPELVEFGRVRGHEAECQCWLCSYRLVAKKLRDDATIDRLLDAQFMTFCTICRGRHSLSDPCSPRAATEASVSDGSIEPLKAAITELSEKQQNTLFCWMHDTLDCRRFKE